MRDRRNEEGAVTALVAALVMSGLLFGLAAMVVDLGLARDQVQESQISSDASALAAANALYPPNGGDCTDKTDEVKGPCLNDAIGRAKALAKINFGSDDLTGCAVPSGFHPKPGDPNTCVAFFPTTAAPTKVSVIMPQRNVPARFTGGNVSTVRSVPVSTSAQAAIVPSIEVTCGLCFLGSIDTTKFDASVSPGGIAVNGSVKMSGSGSDWSATTIGYTGTFDSNNKINETGTLSKIDGFPDPWLNKPGVPPVVPSDYPTRPANTNPCTGGPGIYGDYEFKRACTFATGGLYVVQGAWTWKNVTVTAPGVTLYFRPAGSIDTKNGDLVLTSPTTGDLAGLGIIYDPANTHDLLLQGNGSSQIIGAIYAPASTWKYNGTSDVIVSGGPVILGSMTGNGTTGVKVLSSKDVDVLNTVGDVWLDQ
jgi:hypothetical protein